MGGIDGAAAGAGHGETRAGKRSYIRRPAHAMELGGCARAGVGLAACVHVAAWLGGA